MYITKLLKSLEFTGMKKRFMVLATVFLAIIISGYISDGLLSMDATESRYNEIDNCNISTTFTITYTTIRPNDPCEATFCKTTEGNKRKIDSYDFAKAEPHMKQFVHNLTSKVVLKGTGTSNIEIPVLVSAVSSNHFEEALELCENLNDVVRPAYPTAPLFIFDLGLKPEEILQIKDACNCMMVAFPFEKFPPHVKDLFSYTWKPLLMQMMLQTYRFAMWMDTSIRFDTADLDPLFIEAKRQGVMSNHVKFLLPSHVHEDTFLFLQEPPCLFRNFTELEAGMIMFHTDNKLVHKYIFIPWLKCALIEECMKTKLPTGDKMLKCKFHRVYHECHRYDQAVLSLLLYRLFPTSYADHLGPVVQN